MKKITTVFSLFFLLFSAHAQKHICGAGGYSTFSMQAVSFEDTVRNGSTSFNIKLRTDDSSMIDTLYFTDTALALYV